MFITMAPLKVVALLFMATAALAYMDENYIEDDGGVNIPIPASDPDPVFNIGVEGGRLDVVGQEGADEVDIYIQGPVKSVRVHALTATNVEKVISKYRKIW